MLGGAGRAGILCRVCREGVAHSRGDWVEFMWLDRPQEVLGIRKLH